MSDCLHCDSVWEICDRCALYLPKTRLNTKTIAVIKKVLRAREKGKTTIGHVFGSQDAETTETELENLGFRLDRFDMWVTDIFWDDVNFDKLEMINK